MRSNFEKDPVGIVLNIIISRKGLILAGFLGVIGITLLGVKFMPPVYEAYAKLYINPPALPRQVDAPFLEEITGRTFLGNQKEILRSRVVYQGVATRLRMSEIAPPENILQKAKAFIKERLLGNKQIIDMNEVAITNIRMNSAVEFIRGTNIALVIAKASNPESAALLANTIADVYVGYANSMISNTASEAYGYIEKRVEETAEELKRAEDELNGYKEKNNTLMIDEEKEYLVKSLTDLEDSLQKTDLELSEVQRLIVNQKKGGVHAVGAVNIGTGANENPGQSYIKSLDDQLIEYETQLNTALISLTEDHPDVKLIRSKIKRIKDKIKEYNSNNQNPGDNTGAGSHEIDSRTMKLENIKQELINRKNILMKQKDVLLAKKKGVAGRLVEYDKLNSKYLQLKNKLALLSAKMEDATILQASENQNGSIRIIEPAHAPIEPSSTKTKILLVLGVFAGIVFSLGMAFIAEYFDKSFKNIVDVEQYLDLPVFGSVPKLSEKQKQHLLGGNS